MRITDKIIFEGSNRSIATTRERAQQAAREASTGIRVEHPGDDPGAAGQIVAARAGEIRHDAINKTVARANDELLASDAALGTVNTGLMRAQQLATQLANGNYSPSDLQSAVTEVESIIQTAVAALNTRVGDRYVFGGNKDGLAPFDSTGAYLGDDGVRRIEIAPGVLQETSIRADVAVKGAGGGVDVFASLGALRDALAAGDNGAVGDTLGALKSSVDQISAARARAGAQMNVLDTAADIARLGKDTATGEASRLTDADFFDATSRMALGQRALEAALSISARSFELTLLNKLR